MDWYLGVLKKYMVFEGRARRKEYWMFVLFHVLILMGLGLVDRMLSGEDGGFLTGLYALAVLLPSLGVSVRRLHDTDRSGWWLLISFVPVVGFLVLLFFTLQAGTPGANRFGPDPLD